MKGLPLADPRFKNLEMGSKDWFATQRRVIKSKPLIKKSYDLWYRLLLRDAESVPAKYRDAGIVELGSGAGYIKEFNPKVVTSDVSEDVADMVIDGRKLPFDDQALKAVFLTHVFHHIPDVEQFLHEADRVLVPGGVIAMIEVTHTPFGRFFFSRIHPEPYDDRSSSWSFPQTNSMLDSNQALSWIVFVRDVKRFNQKFPNLVLERMAFLPWFSYLLSGGVNLRSAVPTFLTPVVSALDTLLKPLDRIFATHWHVTIRKSIDTQRL